MLSRLVGTCLKHPRLIAVAAALALVAGGLTLARANYDVFPDFVPPQAEIQTESPGLSAAQVEQLVTRPVEQAVNGAQGVKQVRSTSIQGLSIVQVIFNDGSEPYRARQIVAEALNDVPQTLPNGVGAPTLSPLTSPTMDLLAVGFLSKSEGPQALRDWVQWKLRPRLMAVPGVARAAVYGGEVRRIEVRVDPHALQTFGLSLSDVVAATQAATAISGGGFIDTSEQRILVEPKTQAATTDDIAAAPITAAGAQGLHIGDVAQVVEAPAPDFGDAVIMGKPGVLIVLSSQYGSNTLKVTHEVEKALAEMKPAMASQGIEMVTGLHRPANFIETALAGITEDLLIGAALIAVILFAFMRNIKTVLISFVSIPLSLLVAIMVLDRAGVTINTMTLGGLAVALGVVVDDAVIDVENIVRRLRQNRDMPEGRSEATIGVILKASLEVRSPVIYATLVVALVLVPVVMMHGLQGAFFAPLATAFILATLISLFIAMTVTPALSFLFLEHSQLPPEPKLMTRLKDGHEKLLRRVFARPSTVMIATGLATLAAIMGLFFFRSELMPSFREGHFVLQVAAQPGTSLQVTRRYGESISKEILAIPGISGIEQAIGRAPGSEDTSGTERSEFQLELKPHLSGARQDAIEAKIHEVLDHYPGLQTDVVTFLGDRIGESLTGETANLAINVYGADADTLDHVANQIASVLQDVKGANDVKLTTPPKAPSVHVDINRQAASARGISPKDVLNAVQSAYKGIDATQIYRTDRVINVAVTLPQNLRQSPEAVGELLVRGANGDLARLSDIAKVTLGDSRTQISHIGGQLVETVTANPKPSEVTRVTLAAKATIAAKVKLPPGVYLDYVSVADDLIKARNELLFNTALALVGIVALLVLAFREARAVWLIVASAPFALVGGVAAVALSGGSLSLGALVGFVTLLGVAARNAILLLAHTDQLLAEGHPWSESTVLTATRERVTPILMTALVTALGLLPLALETGQAGREIQGPMAIVILGGLVTSTFLSLILLPSLIWRFRRRAK
ncbi:efflux RND transporter permease subunit [Asticcacaulis sp. EMRT-3]|uniref:efflux RND transporter permease subunit n=1 Tax=Asticcacaulis sp. EMRT-3 TaxID=3040349 RepID=UPI0024AF1B13|nr:efflux RND transporter permease subunit [Asticcacaulis sp. EMRT-3]MDI7776526.1 efflux RND transporter permease subunit [Asticcacaulis sp. EMRT-3]